MYAVPKIIKTRAFTLVELLLSMALVMILMLVVTQIMRSTQMVTSASRKHLDADDEARMVFDRMEGDIARMVKRTDVDFLINKVNGNDSFYFYSESPSLSLGLTNTTGTNSVALIGYRVNADTTSSDFGQVERLSVGLGYNINNTGDLGSNNMVFLTYNSYQQQSTNVPNPLLTNTPLINSTITGAFVKALGDSNNYQVISPDVFRMEVCFLIKAWTNTSGVAQPPVYSIAPYNTNSTFTSAVGRTSSTYFSAMQSSGNYGNWGEIGLGDVQAIVVTFAILDPTSRKIFPGGNPSQAQIATMIAALPDPVGGSTDLQSNPPALPAQIWQNAIDDGSFVGNAGIPKPAAEQVRIYQRIFPLN